MNQRNLIMLAVIAAGGYLLYSWAKESGYLDQMFGSPQPDPGQLPEPQPNGTACPVPSVYRNGACVTITPDPVPGPQPEPSSLRAELVNAAKDNAYYIQGGGKMNAHQWNWYRNQLRPPEPTLAAWNTAFPSPTDMDLMTVDEFLARMQTVGLGGIIPSQSTTSLSMNFGRGASGGAFSGADKRGFA